MVTPQTSIELLWFVAYIAKPEFLSTRIICTESNPGGGDSTYERGGNARQKFWIKPLKETNLGMAQAFFDP